MRLVYVEAEFKIEVFMRYMYYGIVFRFFYFYKIMFYVYDWVGF